MTNISEQNKQKRISICERLKELRPEAELRFDKYTEKLVVYSASVVEGKVKIYKDTRTIYVKDNPEKLAKLYLTNEEAKQAITEFLEQADAKAMNITKRIVELEKELEFDVSYEMEGDTYGIHKDYSSILFKIDKFHFQYDLDELKEELRRK